MSHTNDDGCDDDTLHRDAERVRKYYGDVTDAMTILYIGMRRVFVNITVMLWHKC